MSFYANPAQNHKQWDYITGNNKMSIMTSRYYYLQEINNENPIKISVRDPESNQWTKWKKFPGDLREIVYNKYMGQKCQLSVPLDVHRSMLPNEIVIESDYPTYQQNFEAAQMAGRIFENKGFSPLYYYSGNKSIHIHIFFNWKSLYILAPKLKKKLYDIYRENIPKFKTEFIEWLRARMISCWDTNVKEFDKDMIKATHLIRCELSKNKQGYKTFIGYSYKDLSFIPYVCNEDNKIYPELGEQRLSSPPNIMEILEEFAEDTEKKIILKKAKRRSKRNDFPLLSDTPGHLRGCVRAILSNDFFDAKEGSKRGLFILISETRRCMDTFSARIVVNDWNSRLDKPFPQKEIDVRFSNKLYTLPCTYIHSFLEEVGITLPIKC